MTGDPCEAWEPWPPPSVVQGQGIVSVILDPDDLATLGEMPARGRPAGFTA